MTIYVCLISTANPLTVLSFSLNELNSSHNLCSWRLHDLIKDADICYFRVMDDDQSEWFLLIIIIDYIITSIIESLRFASMHSIALHWFMMMMTHYVPLDYVQLREMMIITVKVKSIYIPLQERWRHNNCICFGVHLTPAGVCFQSFSQVID